MSPAILNFILVGIITGIFAGFFGVGGGIILIPILMWLFKYGQHEAQGLSLAALLLPVGLLGVYKYYQTSPFSLKPALYIGIGMFLGAYIGATFAQKLSDRSLKVAFGVLTIAAGIKLIFGK